MAKTKVMIATPTPGTVKTAYVKSVLGTMINLSQAGIDCGYETEDGSGIALQRNLLARKFRQSSFSHIFCVDSDMAFEDDLCARLAAADKPIVGAICTTRTFDFSLVEKALRRGHAPQEARLFGFNWLASFRNSGKIEIKNFEADMEHLGFGAILIRREVFETMISCGAARTFSTMEHGEYHGFFNARVADIEVGRDHGEDISFCRRWTEDCGGEISALTNATIYHIGDFSFGGSFQEHLEAKHRLSTKALTTSVR